MKRLLSISGSRLVWLALGALLVATLACGPTTQPTAVPTAVPTPVPAPSKPPEQPPADQGGGASNLTLNNQSGQTVCYLYISPSKSADWGVDQLGSANMVTSGGTFTINNIPVGVYDLKAEDCSNNIIGVEYTADLTSGGDFTWTIEPPAASLTVINKSGTELCYLYVSPSSAGSWGQDQLGASQTIPSGSTFTLTGFPSGTYDLRAETCGGQSVEQRGVTFPFEWTITSG